MRSFFCITQRDGYLGFQCMFMINRIFHMATSRPGEVSGLASALGTIAGRSGAKKKYLLIFMGMGLAMTSTLSLVVSGNWITVIFLSVLVVIGFSGGNVFYDSLLGKFAAVLGPILMGIVGLPTGSPHLAILVVLAPFLVDTLFLVLCQYDNYGTRNYHIGRALVYGR